MEITKEQLEYVRQKISQRESISLDEDDLMSLIDLQITLERIPNSYNYATIDDNMCDSLQAEYLRHYTLKLTLYDVEAREDIAKIAFMKFSLIPTRELMDEEDEYLDYDTDTHNVFSYLMRLDEAQMSDEVYDSVGGIYPYARLTYAELHNFYVSPEFRGLGIAGFLYSQLNDILWNEYNQIIHLLGLYVNPFKDQGTLCDWNMGGTYYDTEEGNEELFRTLRRGLEKNGFVALDEEKRYYYKDMLADIDTTWHGDFDMDDSDFLFEDED